jgi:hypothetical protein
MNRMVRRMSGVAVLAACTVVSGPASAAPPSHLPRTQLTGYQMVQRFMRVLQAHDPTRLSTLLAPSFIVQRANGTWAAKAQYMRDFPTLIIHTFTILESHSTYSHGALTVRWSVTTKEVLPGTPVGPDASPRLSTFVWTSAGWKMTSHGNFNPPVAAR